MFQLIEWLCVAYAAAIILYHVTKSSDAIGHFLRCLRQIWTCFISLSSSAWDLALGALRKILRNQFSLSCVCQLQCSRMPGKIRTWNDMLRFEWDVKHYSLTNLPFWRRCIFRRGTFLGQPFSHGVCMLRECIYGEYAHEQHLRRTLTLTLTLTLYSFTRSLLTQ